MTNECQAHSGHEARIMSLEKARCDANQQIAEIRKLLYTTILQGAVTMAGVAIMLFQRVLQ